MKRKEQIEVATATYINGRLKNNVPPEEIEEIRLAYQAGAIYSDEHPDLYSVTRKAVERERKHLIEKACEWLKFNYAEFTDNTRLGIKIDELIKDFKQAMEEQQ